jgi:hypothetical protein
MKQKFVNATMNDCRKGKECGAQSTHCHPLRPTAISESKDHHHHPLPVKVVSKKDPASDVESLKMELVSAIQSVKKGKRISRCDFGKLESMMKAKEPEPPKEYADILAMLLKK